jgi:hypothetical protein
VDLLEAVCRFDGDYYPLALLSEHDASYLSSARISERSHPVQKLDVTLIAATNRAPIAPKSAYLMTNLRRKWVLRGFKRLTPFTHSGE